MDYAILKDRMGGKLQAQKQEPKKGKIISMPTANTELAPINSDYIALTNNALDIINENLKSQQLSFALFDVIKSPSGGATAFTIPGLSGDEIEKELTGIILDYTTPRAYWDTPDPVEGTPPVCWSKDSVISHDGNPCNRCEFNEFGSKGNGDSSGKACKESVQLLLLRQDNIMPVIVRVPVSSKTIFLRYMTRLVGKMIPLSGVVTKITLDKAVNKTGQPYAMYSFEAIDALSPEETANARAFGQKFTEILNAAEVEPEMQAAG